MRNKVSLVVLTGSGSRARQFCTSRATLRWVAAAALVASAVFVFLVWDYIRLRSSAVELTLRETQMSGALAGQREEIELQRRQIGEFAQEINQLKERLLSLNAFEKKIRIMADSTRRTRWETSARAWCARCTPRSTSSPWARSTRTTASRRWSGTSRSSRR
jgi:hypothetical protein